MKNFVIRAITGVLFVAVIVGCMFNPLSFGVLFCIISALTVFEFSNLINQSGEAVINRYVASIASAYLFLAMMTYCTEMSGIAIFLPYLLLLLCLFISELYLKQKNPLGNLAYTMLSQMYIGLGFSLLNLLAFHIDAQHLPAYNPIIPLSVFVFIWLNDTGAYCVGVLFGRHRLFERISPKKSWEGSFGGAAVAIASACFFARFFPFMTVGEWIGLAVVVVVFATWGDLVESLMKRQLGIKDSGHILPGHGGLLDRFDSALLAIPAAVVYLYLLPLL